jgi:photosystem II stability/assembly factor-like uncharacterized protein
MRTFTLTVLIIFIALYARPNWASAQLVHLEILRPDFIGDTSWSYFDLATCDDHNFCAAANWLKLGGSIHRNNPCLVLTSDAGNTWSVKNPRLFPDSIESYKFFHHLAMIDSAHIIAIGDTGLIIRSSDAGENWIRQDFPTPHPLSDIHFANAQEGIIAGGGIVLTTSNGGESWNPVNHAPYYTLRSCHAFGNGRFAFFCYDKSNIYTTNDNWVTRDSVNVKTATDSVVGYNGIVACHYMGNDSILAVGAVIVGTSAGTRRSRILLSVDRGRTWVEQLYRFTYGWAGVASTSNTDLWLCGGYKRGLLMSTNHGASWIDDSVAIPVPLPDNFEEINSIQAISPTVAILGLDSYIAKLNLTTFSVEQYQREVYGTLVYPNPASSNVKIVSSYAPNCPISLVDVLGHTIFEGSLSSTGTMSFDVAALPAGMYAVIMDFNGAKLHVSNLVVLPK